MVIAVEVEVGYLRIGLDQTEPTLIPGKDMEEVAAMKAGEGLKLSHLRNITDFHNLKIYLLHLLFV